MCGEVLSGILQFRMCGQGRCGISKVGLRSEGNFVGARRAGSSFAISKELGRVAGNFAVSNASWVGVGISNVWGREEWNSVFSSVGSEPEGGQEVLPH